MQKQILAPCLENWLKKNLELLWVPDIYATGSFPLPPNTEGIALGKVFLHSRMCPILPCSPQRIELLIHELIHIRQQQKSLYLPWFFAYGLAWMQSGFQYRKNLFEKYTYKEARRLLRLYLSENPCSCLEFS